MLCACMRLTGLHGDPIAVSLGIHCQCDHYTSSSITCNESIMRSGVAQNNPCTFECKLCANELNFLADSGDLSRPHPNKLNYLIQ